VLVLDEPLCVLGVGRNGQGERGEDGRDGEEVAKMHGGWVRPLPLVSL
jgi:hypothetical protein